MPGIPKGQTPQWLVEDAAKRAAILKKTIFENPFIPPEPKGAIAEELWKPWRQPLTKQIYLLTNNYDEILYGGAAGGGKSDGLLMAALQYVQWPGYSALILRRTYAELNKSEAIMNRAYGWLYPWVEAKVVHWSGEAKRFTFPSGATLEFGYLANEKDLMQYQSAEYNFIGVDELTHFPLEGMYTYMFSRIRKKEYSPIPSRMMAATNPGGPGAGWVKARWGLSGFMEYNVVHYINKVGEHKSRLFISALFTENSHIDQDDYASKLGELEEVKYAQLALGDWDVVAEGHLFKQKYFYDERTGRNQYIDRSQLPEKRRRVRFWDMAATPLSQENKDPDFTAGVLYSVNDDLGNFYIEDFVEVRKSPPDRDEYMGEIAAMDAAQDKAAKVPMHTPIRVEQEGGAQGKSWVDLASRSPVFMKYDFDGQSVGRAAKDVRAQIVATAAKQGRVFIVSAPWNSAFLSYLYPFPQEGIHDDAVDALSGAHTFLVGEPIPPLDLKDLEGMHSTLFYG